MKSSRFGIEKMTDGNDPHLVMWGIWDRNKTKQFHVDSVITICSTRETARQYRAEFNANRTTYKGDKYDVQK